MRQVVVIGAGPGGSTAAILLARRGFHVTLIEQHRFPRHKVCGECLSALGIEVMDRLGLTAKLLAAGAVELCSAALHTADGAVATVDLPRPMLGLSRHALDSCLVDEARGSGARIEQPARCEAMEPGPLVRIRDLVTNEIRELRPESVIVADGKRGSRASSPMIDFGIQAHFEDVDGPRDTIELFATRNRYGGLAAIEGARWNAAFSVSTRQLREHHGDVSSLFATLTDGNPALRQRLARARRIGPWRAAPLPRASVTNHWPKGVIPIGNSAAALEPIGGEGMGLAMRSAELAADSLANDPPAMDIDALRRSYRGLWRKRRLASRSIALAFSTPMAATIAMHAVHAQPALARLALRLIGK